MPLPRAVFPGRFYMITRSCTQQQFLLRPDEVANNAIIYCLALAALHSGVLVLMTLFESNHHHTIIYDPSGRCSEFVEYLHKIIARSHNRLLGRSQYFWDSQEPCITELVDPHDVIAKMVYAASNPVKDGLVERANEWPGVTGYMHLLEGRPLKAVRPDHFFRKNRHMPAEVSLDLTIPPELGDVHEVISAVREGVEAVERTMRAERGLTGRRVLGTKRILAQRWTDAPTTTRALGGLRPRFAARDENSRVAALLRYQEFQASYRHARLLLKQGLLAIFPAGTYWLRRFAGVTVEQSPGHHVPDQPPPLRVGGTMAVA